MADEEKHKKKRGSIAAIKMDPTLMRAMLHPTRVEIVSRINKPGVLLSPARFAEDTALSVSNASYHFKQLVEMEFIELAETVPVRGATEHLYRASRRLLFDSEEWARLPAIFKAGSAGQALTGFLLACREAIEAGTFEARDNSHLSWASLRLDERAWCEASAILAAALDKLLGLEEAAEPRIAAGAEVVDSTFSIGLFEAPRHDIGDQDNSEWRKRKRRRDAGLEEDD